MQELTRTDGRLSEHRSLVRVDTGEEITVGKDYEPLANKRIAEAIEPLFDMGFHVSKVRSYDSRRFYITLVSREMKMNIGGEEAAFTVNIQNSYDKSLRLGIQAGAIIFVCSNGLTIGKGVSISMKHTRQMKDFQFAVSDRIPTLYKNMFDLVERKDWTISDMEAVQTVFEKLTKPFPRKKDNQPNIVGAMIQKQFQIDYEKYSDQPEFALYMAATNVATHGYGQGIPPTYILELEKLIPEVFFKN